MHPSWRELPAKGRLDSKLKFARAQLTRSPLPVDVKQKGLLVIEDIDSLSEDRHWLIHSAADAVSFPDSIRLARTHLHEKPTPLIEERHVKLAEVLLFGDASRQASDRLAQFILRELTPRYQDHSH